MSISILSEKIEQLPPEARKQVQEYIEFLYERYVQKEKSKKSTQLSENPFFGKWKDRPEMKNATEWVKKVRDSQWGNQ